ncbi:glycosyltransferase family 2 protein [Lutibacter holmesii]|uniref:Glycosyltransferase family 2 protein n=1 Tax=Lutibacter holmesii TaxID=1137985 RepID=A0ABW3WR45_9FLAO
MIVIYHDNLKVTKVISNKTGSVPFEYNNKIAEIFIDIAKEFPEELIFWCHQLYEDNLNLEDVHHFMSHHRMMLSYNPSENNYFVDAIGYVEQSPFININKSVKYPTWQMSSTVGVIHAAVLNALQKVIQPTLDFDYFLNSLAKLAMPSGLFCYSEPSLLQGKYENIAPKCSKFSLYTFVKQHYKLRWLFLLFLNEFIYEKKISLFPLLQALFKKSKRNLCVNLKAINVNTNVKNINKGTIDVIIPTIGRKHYLYNVLCDLKKQTYLPKNVIIVEQNPIKNSKSELDYLTNEDWPFTIKHTFTHQPGACNARNVALSQVESEWVFFADDDIRFESRLISEGMNYSEKYNICSLITSCLKPEEKIKYKIINQTTIFGSGFSFVKSSCLKDVVFDMAFEFGYGEDSDFGMQLRHKGYDIIYFPNLNISHLHAPMGGFRIKPKLAWDNEVIQPKPSPTIMLLKLKYDSKQQLKGYKTLLFLKLYFKGDFKMPFSFYKSFQEKWNTSIVWAKKVSNNA